MWITVQWHTGLAHNCSLTLLTSPLAREAPFHYSPYYEKESKLFDLQNDEWKMNIYETIVMSDILPELFNTILQRCPSNQQLIFGTEFLWKKDVLNSDTKTI